MCRTCPRRQVLLTACANRAGVERVMAFEPTSSTSFFALCPNLKMLVSSGIQLIKYWFSISDEGAAFALSGP
jgi:polyphosphate kinase 2 (PPK2 family)